MSHGSFSSYAAQGSSRVSNCHDSDYYQSMMGPNLDIPMGDLWSDLTSTISKTTTQLYQQGITSLQNTATKEATKLLYQITGANGQTMTVSADSPEYKAYVAQGNIPQGPSFFDKHEKEIYVAGGIFLGLMALGVLVKVFK